MSIGHLLRESDPLARERIPSDRRGIIRQLILTEVDQVPTGPVHRLITRKRLAVLVVLAVAALAVPLWPRVTLHAAVRFEIRMAQEQPGPGLTAAYVSMSGRTVYVHDDAVVTNEDIQQSRIVTGENSSTFGIHVEFTPDGAQKMLQATATNVGGLMAIILDGQTVMAPVIRTPVSAIGLISGNYTYAEAERIAEGIRFPS